MEVFYNGNLLKDNQFLSVSETQMEADIKLNVEPNKLYTLVLYDPDAVSGTYIHWTKVNITNNDIKTGNIIIPYKGPAPPPKTGKHHYIFNLYEQNGENKMCPLEQRAVNLNDLKNILGVYDPVYRIQFISENANGGKRRNRNKTRKHTKMIRNIKTKIKRKLRKNIKTRKY
jgi:phosphatidylethanolamine-binding protein (PEBP) family uncharacterized protein